MTAVNQLFIGRLPRGSRSRDLEDMFYKYGKMTRCDVKQGIKMAYGFIEYEDKRDAEDAVRGENGRDFQGSKIVVEWARGPKYDYRKDRYRDDDHPGYHDSKRDFGRSRSPRYDDRYDRYDRRGGRSPSPRYYDRRGRSRSPRYDDRRGRSRSYSPRDRYERHRSRSRS